MFKYPEFFAKKCQDVYPGWEDLHFYIKNNKKNEVGRLLHDARGFPLDEDQIISLFRNKKENKILESALFAKAKRELYLDWMGIVDEFNDKHVEGE